jgi:hypothetical protein
MERRIMSKTTSLLFSLFLFACGNNDCEDAKEKATDCGGAVAAEAATISDDRAAECNEKDQCRAECVNNATCAEMAELEGPFVTCAIGCER